MSGFSAKLPPLPGLLWVIALWALFYACSDVHAESANARPDTRVVIDVSGSMKKTDPQNLRVSAVKLLLNLAKDESRLGIWLFGQQVNNLVPLATVTPEWKKAHTPSADAIHSRGLFTHIGAALEAASMGQTTPDPAWDRTIVLLSDGMVDISKDAAANAKEKNRILETLVPRLRAAGFHIRTVALSDSADREFLKTLALQTEGSFVEARNADELLNAFVETSDKVNLPEQVPLEGNRFTIDDSVKEFTALIFRKSGLKQTRLLAPDGQEFSLAKGSRNVSWFGDKEFDLVTVYNPVPGIWTVDAELDPANRVTVISDLELVMEGLPENVLEGEKVTMNLSLVEHGRTITNPSFLQLMDITFGQQSEQGESFEGKLSQDADGNPRVPDDGIYSAKLGRTLVEGLQTFTVSVDGKTFKRKKTQTMAVYRDVLDVRTDYRDESGQLMQFLVAEPRPGLVDPEHLDLIAQIQDPKGGKSIQTASLQADGRMKIEVPPQAGLGNYDVLIKVKGTSSHGKPFELIQGPYAVDYTPIAATSAPAADAQTPPQVNVPPVTFDADAMNIPSLDVEELPPEDMVVPAPETQQPAEASVSLDQVPAAESGAEVDAAEDTEGTNWMLLMSLFILGNVAIVGVGLFYYLRFLRKTDVEQTRVVDEITQLKQKQKDDLARAVANAGAAEEEEPPAAALDDFLAEDATVLRTEPEPLSAPKTVPAVSAPPPPATPAPVDEAVVPIPSYSLDLEDDEIVEVDEFEDEFDGELPDEVANLDDLDMMLNEQEDMTSDTELNQTIDAMLEQPTVFPDKKKAANDKTSPRFADDEFMLDNPDTKT